MNKKYLIFMFGILILVGIVFSLPEIKINVKPYFNVFEEVSFNYSIKADRNGDISYIPSIKCIDVSEGMISPETISLTKDQFVEKNYYGFNMTDKIEPQQCIAKIQVIRPFILVRQEIFRIVNEPSISFSLNLCEDSGCLDKSKVFVKSSKIYLDYLSEEEDLIISAKLFYPNNETRAVSIPGVVSLRDEGNYRIDINVIKAGYRNFEESYDFSIISRNAVIDNLFYEKKITPEGEEIKVKSSFFWIFFIGVVVVIILVVLILLLRGIRFRIFKRKEKGYYSGSGFFHKPKKSRVDLSNEEKTLVFTQNKYVNENKIDKEEESK